MLFKNKGSPKDLNNYRNLALQSVIRKVITSALAKRITRGNVTSIYQHGFKPASFCTDAVLEICELVNTRLADREKRMYVSSTSQKRSTVAIKIYS